MERISHPEDRVSVKNIIEPADKLFPFVMDFKRKEEIRGVNAETNAPDTIVREYVESEERLWNTKNGFFFIYGGRPFVIKPGETKVYPRYLAEHAARTMVNHILNEMHAASKRMSTEGIPIYDKGILTNKPLKDKLTRKIITGVVEWHNGGDDDFDSLTHKEYGTSYDNIEETTEYDDILDENVPVIEEEKKHKGKARERTIEQLREECDVNGIEWQEADTKDVLMEKIKKETSGFN